jgi:hypothetical protein
MYQWVALILVFGGMGYELVDELWADIFKNNKKDLEVVSEK